MNYPPMNQNPLCRCAERGPLAGMAAMFCRCGHMTECHFPFTCQEAACAHLSGYDFAPEEIEKLEASAYQKVASGQRAPYALDEAGSVIVMVNGWSAETKNPRQEPRV